MFTYQNYCQQDQSLSFQQADNIHQKIVEAIQNNNQGQLLYEEILKAGKEYIQIRMDWAFLTKEEKKKVNEIRTQKHNAVIASFDALASFCQTNHLDTSWRDEIGYEENGKGYRKRIGDMGCYLAFISSLSTR